MAQLWRTVDQRTGGGVSLLEVKIAAMPGMRDLLYGLRGRASIGVRGPATYL